MSRRVMSCLEQFSPALEVYSIDEAFLKLDGFVQSDFVTYGKAIRQAVLQWTGIPVSVGIGPTKTLAKVANRVAKRQTQTGVFDLSSPDVQRRVLPTLEVEDIWGISHRWGKRLRVLGIETAEDLSRAEPGMIRQKLNVVGERIVHELRGTACLDLEAVQPKQNILCSRSFGRPVTELGELQAAISTYAARAAEKLRRQSSRTGGMQVFLKTNRYRVGTPQYHGSTLHSFWVPTHDTRELIGAARRCVGALYKTGYEYYKCGVMLMDITPAHLEQTNLFVQVDNRQRDELMGLVDRLNQTMGSGTVFFGAQGIQQGWQLRCELRSQRYTTRWPELLVVHC